MAKFRSFADMERHNGGLSSTPGISATQNEGLRKVRTELLTLLASGRTFTTTEIMRQLNDSKMPLRGPALTGAINNALVYFVQIGQIIKDENAGITYYKASRAAPVSSTPSPITAPVMTSDQPHDINKLDQAIWTACRDRKPRTAQAIAMLLENKGFRKDVVRERVLTLFRHKTWFTRDERSDGVYYALMKTCKSPDGELPKGNKEAIPEFGKPVGKPVEIPTPNPIMADALSAVRAQLHTAPVQPAPQEPSDTESEEANAIPEGKEEAESSPTTLYTLRKSDSWPVMIVKCLADRKWQGTGDVIRTLETMVGFDKPKNGTNIYNHINVMKRTGILDHAPGERGHLYRLSECFDVVKYLESNGQRTLAMCMKTSNSFSAHQPHPVVLPDVPARENTPMPIAPTIPESTVTQPLLAVRVEILGVPFTSKEIKAILPTLIDLAAEDPLDDDGDILVVERIVRVKGIELNQQRAVELLQGLKEYGLG